MENVDRHRKKLTLEGFRNIAATSVDSASDPNDSFAMETRHEFLGCAA